MNELKEPIKPIGMKRIEFEDELRALIQKSDLPAYFIYYILEGSLRDISSFIAQNDEKEKKEYILALSKYKSSEKESKKLTNVVEKDEINTKSDP